MDDTPVRADHDDERSYLLARSKAHADIAAQTDDAAQRALHERFAALYAGRAADL